MTISLRSGVTQQQTTTGYKRITPVSTPVGFSLMSSVDLQPLSADAGFSSSPTRWRVTPYNSAICSIVNPSL